MRDTERERLNEHLRKKFYEERNYYNLERYVMSELMSPIEDYFNAIDIIKKNSNLNIGLNLYYIAAYLCAEWLSESNEFLVKLNNMMDKVEDKEKAIIYYLNAHALSCSSTNWRKCAEYRFFLLKSIQYSKNIRFVNNKLDLANISKGREAENYLKEALINIEQVETKETLKNKTVDYWLSSQRFVNEFILGTHMSQEVYIHKFGGEKESIYQRQ